MQPVQTIEIETAVRQKPVVVPAGQGRWIDLGDHRGFVTVSSQDNDGAFMLLAMDVDAGGGPPPHIHSREDETFYIQEGNFTFRVGEQIVSAGPGDTLYAPRHIEHAWRCVSPEGGKALVLISPGTNFESFATELSQTGITPLEPGALVKLLDIAGRHGLEIVPPAK